MAESSVRNDGYARAPDLLKGYVASAVGYHSVGVPAEIHRGLPSPYLTFVFSLADPIVTGHSLGHARGPMAHRTKIILAGLGPKPTYIVPNENQIGLQLAVHPLAARALFGLPRQRAQRAGRRGWRGARCASGPGSVTGWSRQPNGRSGLRCCTIT